MKVNYSLREKLYTSIFFIFGVYCSLNAQTLNPSSISTNGSVNAIAQDSTSIYIGGNFTIAGYKSAGAALINSNGKCISSFPSIGGTIHSTIADNNGGWFIGGSFSYQGKLNLIHILADNSIDPSFTCNTNSTVKSLVLEGNSLYIGGEFSQINNQNINYLALADATTGSIDLSWNPNPNNDVNTLLKDGNSLYVGGAFTNIANSGNKYFAVLNIVSATSIPSISARNTVNTIKQDSNNIYIGGTFAGDNGFATLNSALVTTSSDIPIHNFPKLDGLTITSISDGNGGWYIGGTFTYQGISNLIHILPDYSIDNNFTPNPNNYPQTLYLDGNTLYVGGTFTQIGGQNINYLASINAITGVTNTTWNPNPNNAVRSILKDNNKLYVGGIFTNIGNSENKYFAIVDTNTAEIIQSISTEGSVNIIKQDNDNIYVGGSYGGVNGFFTGTSAMLSTSSDLPSNNFPKIIGQTYVSIPDGNGGWYIGGSFNFQSLTNLIHVLPNYSVDTTFSPNPNGIVKTIFLDGSTLYVGGLFTQINNQSKSYLAAINAISGTLINSWSPNPNSDINSIAKNGSSIYVGGNFTNIGGQPRNYLAEIDNANGLATSWNPNPNTFVTCLKLNSNELLVGGNFITIGGQNRNKIAAIDLASGLANLWNPNANNIVNTIEIKGSTVFIGGTFTNVGGQTRNRIAEIDLSSGIPTTWNPDANNTVKSISIVGDDVIAGGDFTLIGGQTRKYLVSISSIGGSINSWDPIPSGPLNNVNSFNSSIIITGNFTHTKAVSRNNLLSISKSNNLITSWNPNPNSQVLDIEISGTTMYVGGSFAGIGGQSRNYLGQIDISTGLATLWNPSPNAQVHAIDVINNTIYVGGNFSSIGGENISYLAAINSIDGIPTNWNPKPSGLVNSINNYNNIISLTGNFKYLKTENRNRLLAVSKTDNLITNWDPNSSGPIHAIEINGNNMFVGGSFNTISGEARNSLAEIDLTTGLASTWNANSNNVINSIKLIGSSLYVGGNFTNIGGQPRNYLASLNPIDGTATSWNPKPNAAVLDIQQSNQDIIISGFFTFVNAEQRNNLLKISKADDLITDWNPSPNNIIQSIELNGLDGFFGGGFTSIGGQSRNRIAEINLSSGLATSWNPNSNNAVKTMKLNGSTLYVGGSFTNIGGQTRNNLAALDTTSGLATPWSPNPNAVVNKLAVSNNILYVAGNYTTITGQNRNRLASFTTTDGILTTWNPNVSGNINDLFLTDSTIYIGGEFTQVASQPRSYIASFAKNTGNLKNWKPILNGSVTSLISFGKYIYTGGTFTSSGGQSCSGFTMINANSGFPKLYFPIVPTFTQINTMSSNTNQLFLGGNFTSIDSKPFGGLATIDFPSSYFEPNFEEITPSIGSIGGIVSVAINGNGFSDGTTVTFTKDGQPDIIIPSNLIYITDNIHINFVLDLNTPVALGLWNVKINIPNENTIFVPNAFEVKTYSPISIQTNIIGFNTIRPNQWQTYSLVVQNNGINDASGVPVYLSLDPNNQINFISQISITDSSGNIINSDMTDSFIPVDNLFGSTSSENVYALLIGNLPAGQNMSINFKVKTSSTNSMKIRTWHGNPINSATALIPTNLIPEWTECAVEILDEVMGFAPPQAQCAYNFVSAAVSPLITQAITGVYYTNTSNWFLTVADAAVFGCYESIVEYSVKIEKTREFFNRLFELTEQIKNIPNQDNQSECLNTILPIDEVYENLIAVVTSRDPNEKQGPLGHGTNHYYNPKNKLPYIIRYENVQTASAPAQTVIIEDNIDSSVFDVSSFQLGFITIGNRIIEVPIGLKHFETDVDLNPEINIIVRIEANFDTNTNIAKWIFKSIDPITLLETSNPLEGFLPPNNIQQEGEGSVMFSINTLENIQHDQQILNSASIIFDNNETIITNQWSNLADIIKPTSQVNNIINIQNDGVSLDLTWEGNDEGSGINYYTLYYSTNGGPFEMLVPYLYGTSYTFIGEINSTYAFFTIATDNVGNVEDMKTMGEAQVSLGVNQNELFKGISIYPNPNQGDFTLFLNSKEDVIADLTITDIVGRVIFSKKQEFNMGNNHILLNLTNDGIYILTVNEKNNKVSKIVIIER